MIKDALETLRLHEEVTVETSDMNVSGEVTATKALPNGVEVTLDAHNPSRDDTVRVSAGDGVAQLTFGEGVLAKWYDVRAVEVDRTERETRQERG